MRTVNILQGRRVRLTAVQLLDLREMVKWYEDAGFLRLFDATPAYPRTEASLREQLEEQQKRQNGFVFAARLLEDDRLIGKAELRRIEWNNAKSRQESCAVTDRFFLRIFKIIEMKRKDALGIQLVEFTKLTTPAVKMGCIDRQADVIAVCFLDDIESGTRCAYTAPPKTQELKR